MKRNFAVSVTEDEDYGHDRSYGTGHCRSGFRPPSPRGTAAHDASSYGAFIGFYGILRPLRDGPGPSHHRLVV